MAVRTRKGLILGLGLGLGVVATACGDDAPKPHEGGARAQAPSDPQPSSELMAPSYLEKSVRMRRKTHWFGMYLRDGDAETKLGWMKLWMRPTVRDEPGAYAVGTEGTWNAGDGELTNAGARYYAAEPPFRVIEMTMTQRGPDGSKAYRAVVDGKVMKMTTAIGDAEPVTIDLPPTRETLGTVYAQMALDPFPLRIGMTGSYYEFDVGDRTDHEIVVTVEKVLVKASKTVGKTTVVDINVRNNTEGIKWRTRIAEDGIPIITTRGPVIIRLEDERFARGAPVAPPP